ncbi:WD40-repeat-containing domain protein [Cyathus striatus]|nr:WD40-repeat-containing domain protein [Cyathus striatus]
MYLPSFLQKPTDKYSAIACLRGSKGLVNCVSFSPSGMLLASGGDDETVHIWDLEKKTCQQAIEDHCSRWGQITAIKWFPGSTTGDTTFAFGTGQGLVLVYRQSDTMTAYHELSNTQIFSLNEPVESIVIDPNGSLTTLWIKDGNSEAAGPIIPRAVYFHDNYKTLLVFLLETGEICSCCRFSDSGKEDWHKILKSPIFDLYDISKTSPTRTFEVPTKQKHLYIKGSALAEDGALALCGSDNGRYRRYVLEGGNHVFKRLTGKLIASSLLDKKPIVHVWKKQTKDSKVNKPGYMGTRPSFMNLLNFLAIIFLFWLTADVWRGYVREVARNVVSKVHAALEDPTRPEKGTINVQYGPEIQDNSIPLEKSKWGFSFSG